ncbi:MAG TPA: glycosyltransferase [Solirubrobacteraceae bacterium]|jgi:glycosyltransferase involved in cell wall biosynthesis|nr:glycosyltransferase [Solirubrobacteraceae bacterium]
MLDSRRTRDEAAELRRLHRRAGALFGLARKRGKPRRSGREPRSAVHVSPVLFGPDGIVGGGERAAYGFARAVAAELPTTLVTTGPRREHLRDRDLRIEVYPTLGDLGGQRFDPLCYRFLEQLKGADVVHCHQYRVAVSQLAILAAAAASKRAFVTDLGGVGAHFDPRLPVEQCLSGLIALSEFSLRLLPTGVPAHVIPTGVDQRFLLAGQREPEADADDAPGESTEERVLFVGRIMRHKGIDVLIESLPSGVGLDVVGHVYDDEFYALLQRLAVGRDVRFLHGASDEQLADAYCSALVTVLPSVYDDAFGGHWEMPELLGCVLQESMACGTPAICSDVGGMPEVVEHRVSGYVVPPNDPVALGRRIEELHRDRRLRLRLGRQARERALERFAWPAIARRVVSAYAGS